MSLMNTVTKMAIGFAVAKGMEAVQSNGGIGAMMENLSGAAGIGSDAPRQAGGMGALGDILGQLGGGQGGGGGLGDMLGQLSGGQSGGGLGDMLGQLTGAGGGASAGGLGGLGGLLGGLAAARGGQGGGLEALLNQDNPADEPDEEEVAQLMLRAMVQAARSDGDIDASEKAKLLDVVQDGDASDMEAVQHALEEPVDPQGLAKDTPQGLETQVYTMSVNAIDPDNQQEAQFLHSLGQALGISSDTSNAIHDNLGAPRLYR